MESHRFVEVDAVTVDKALAFADTVRPGRNFCAYFGFGERKELFERIEYGFLAVALHHFLKALFAETRRAHLAAQVADDQLRRAAVAAQQRFNVFAGFVCLDVFDRRHMQTFLVNLARLAPAAAGHGTADVALVR